MNFGQTRPIIGIPVIAFSVVLVFTISVVVAEQIKKNVCHLEGNGSYTIIHIPEPAWQTHFDHGDMDVITFYIDADGDRFGSTSMTVEDCTAPAGFVADDTDCDDTDGAINPGAIEIEGDQNDNDCDESTPDSSYTSTCPCTFTEEAWLLMPEVTPDTECTYFDAHRTGLFSRTKDATFLQWMDIYCYISANPPFTTVQIYTTSSEADDCREDLHLIASARNLSACQ